MSRSRWQSKRLWEREWKESRAAWRKRRDDERTGMRRVRIYRKRRKRDHDDLAWIRRITHNSRMWDQSFRSRKQPGMSVTAPYFPG